MGSPWSCCLPRRDPFGGVVCEEFYDQYTQESIDFLHKLFAEIK